MSSKIDSIADFSTGRANTPYYQPMVIVLAAASTGILIDAYWPLMIAVWWISALAGLVVWGLLARGEYNRSSGVVLLISVLALAGGWHHYRWNLFDEKDLGNFARAKKQPVALEAVALNAPRPSPPPEPSPMSMLKTEPSSHFEISAVAIRDADKWQPVSGRAMAYVQGDMPEIEAGDRIRVFGELSPLTSARNPGEFDRAAYLRSHRIRAIVQAQTDCISVVQPGSRWNPSRWLEQIRKKASTLFAEQLDPRQAQLASAVFLGERELIDSDRNEAFMATGTIHILSISGLHVGILAWAMLSIMRWTPIPRFLGLTMVVLITGLYTLMVDVEPPIVRATILVLLSCLSQFYGRPGLSFNSLAAAALVVLAINPSDLFNVGAQLSFMSVAAIMWLWPRWSNVIGKQDPLQTLIYKNTSFFERKIQNSVYLIWELVEIGVVIWAITQPLVSARFHIFSPIALVLNAVLWLPMTFGLLSGFVFLFIAAIVPPLAGIAAYCCNMCLWLLESGIVFFSSMPYSHFWVTGPNNWWLTGFYGGLALWAVVPAIRLRTKWAVAVLAGWTVLGFTISYLPHDSNRLHCTFLAVGHGSATLLELPSGKTVLCDAGQFGSPTRAARIIAGMLYSRGISRIDSVVLSHPDIDHYNALPELMEKFSIGAVYVSPVMFAKKTSTMKALKSALDDAKVPVHEIVAGDRLASGGNCSLEVLNPPKNGIQGNDNANSIVLEVDYCGHRIILPGDLESPGLDALLAKQPMHCDVLLAPHHGSRQSNSPGLAAWSTPTWVVLSGDGRWTLPEIDATYESVGSKTLHTFLTGAIEVIVDKNGTKVKTFLEQPTE